MEFRQDISPSIPALYRLLFDQLADSVYITDTDGRILYANSGFEELTGYSSDEVVGQTPRFLRSGVHPAHFYEELWATIQSGTPFRYIFTNRKKNGELYEEGIMISPLRDESGRTVFFLSMGRQINGLRQNFEAFTVLANNSPAGMYIQRNGVISFANLHLAGYVGCEPEELAGREWLDFVVEEDRALVEEQMSAMLDGGLDTPVEYRVTAQDGQVKWMMATVRRVRFEGIEAVSGDAEAGYVVDITDRKRAEADLQLALSLQAATIESTTDGIAIVDRDHHLISHNQRFDEIWNLWGLTALDWEKTRTLMYDQMQEPAQFRSAIARTVAVPGREETGTLDMLDGRHLEFYSKPQVVDGQVVGRVWSWRDITQRRRFEAAMIRLANYDSLTGLLNRHKLQEELDTALSQPKHYEGALLLMDLDSFKEINDTFGHKAGDEVLVQVSKALTAAGTGGLIGRFGGDEFAVLLPERGEAAVLDAAERLMTTVRRCSYPAGNSGVSISASMGVALYPAHGATRPELLSAADLALYEAKSRGSGSFEIYSPDLSQRSRLTRRGDRQAQLGDAILNERGQLYAQETVALDGESPGIFKLTLRMTGARGQVLTTGGLGPLAEQAGFSQALDRWMLREAIELSEQLAAAQTDVALSVELSARSLSHTDVVKLLLRLAEVRDGDSNSVVLQLANLDALGDRGILKTLRRVGYRFELPEMKSFKLMQALRAMSAVDFLALEAAVVREIAKDELARGLVESVVNTARSVGALTIGDGVRDEATLELLRRSGVQYARGHGAGRARLASTMFGGHSSKLEVA